MSNNLYMVYDDSTRESTRNADLTHKALIDQGWRVVHSETGYTTSRYEYARYV